MSHWEIVLFISVHLGAVAKSCVCDVRMYILMDHIRTYICMYILCTPTLWMCVHCGCNAKFLLAVVVPSQVAAPDLEILGPSELRLTWTPPTYVNGPDLRYTIRVIPDLGGPQIDAVVTHTTETSIVLRDLCHGTHIGASVVPSSGFSSEITPGITPEVDMPLSSKWTDIVAHTHSNATRGLGGIKCFICIQGLLLCVHKDVHTYIYTYVCMYIYTYVCTCIYVCIHTYVHTHI